MALDMNAMRQKLDRFKGQEDRSSAFWKPPEGRSVVRIIPWSDRPENPFIEMYFHYGIANRTWLSPISNGNRDPIAEFAEQLRVEGGREGYQEARAYMPKLRTFVPVIVRDEEEEGVRFWSFGKTVFQELLSYIADPDYGDITDMREGRDVIIEYTPQEKSDTNFAKTKIKVKPAITAAGDDDQIEEWSTNQPNFKALFTEPSYDELKMALHRHIDPEGATLEDPSVATETLKPPTQTSDTPDNSSRKTESRSSVADDAASKFEDMFSGM